MQFQPVDEGYLAVFVVIHHLHQLLQPHHIDLSLLVFQFIHQKTVKIFLTQVGIAILVDEVEGIFETKWRWVEPLFKFGESAINPIKFLWFY